MRKRSLRQSLLDNGLLEDFLRTHSLNPASKYFPAEAAAQPADQPLANYMDVSAGRQG